MTSSYLERPIRTKPKAVADILASMADTHLVIGTCTTGLYMTETDIGETRADVVRGLAEGQYHSPVAVLRISRDAPTENVTEEIAKAVVDYCRVHGRLLDEYGEPQPNEFLDEVAL